MATRFKFALLLIFAAAWLTVINYSLQLIDAKSDLQMYAGGTLILASIVVFPSFIRRIFKKDNQ